MSTPFLSTFGLNSRSTKLVEMFIRDEPTFAGYRLWVAKTIDDAYGAPVGSGVTGAGSFEVFRVPSRGFYRSPGIVRRGQGLYETSRKGLTFITYDVEDFAGPGVACPLDSEWFCVRTQVESPAPLVYAGDPTDPVLGPIYMIPPAIFFGSATPAVTLSGTAPSATGCAAGSVPAYDEDLTVTGPRPMHIVFPRPMASFTLVNTEAGGGNSLLVSFGPGQQMQELEPGVKVDMFIGQVRELVLACPDAGGATFAIQGIASN